MPHFTNLIWDFDGTLFDTYPMIALSFREALHRAGIDLTYEEVMRHVKRSVGEALDFCHEQYGLDRDALMSEYRRIQSGMGVERMNPYPGVVELLSKTQASGSRHYLYTHRDILAMTALERHDLIKLFSGFVTADHGFPPKPAPDALLWMQRHYELDAASCLMVGDRNIDIDAAHNAGIAGCLFDPDHFYDHYVTQYRAHSVEQLMTILIDGM